VKETVSIRIKAISKLEEVSKKDKTGIDMPIKKENSFRRGEFMRRD